MKFNPLIIATEPTHMYNGDRVKIVSKWVNGNVVIEFMSGEHIGKWTHTHRSELTPLDRPEVFIPVYPPKCTCGADIAGWQQHSEWCNKGE